jgi:predicted dehydrogenase
LKIFYTRLKRYILKTLFRLGFLRIKKNPNCIRWGVIGLGYMGELLSSTIDFSNSGVVFAVASRSKSKAGKFAMRHGKCKAYGDYESMICDDTLNLDIIYICTPLETHYELIEKCLKSGRNVICEKPITKNDFQLQNLMRLASEKKCFLMEAMWMKCLPTFRKAVELVEGGKIGRLQCVRADLNKHEIYDDQNHLMSGGVLANYGIYPLAFVSFFLKGLPEDMTFTTCRSPSHVDTNWHIQGSRNGVAGIINISSNFATSNKAIVIGDNGSIIWDSPFNRTNTLTLMDATGREVRKFCFKYQFEGFEYQVEEVVRCLSNNMTESEAAPLEESVVVANWMRMLVENTDRESS